MTAAPLKSAHPASASDDKIVIENLEIRYGLVTAVNGINFTIKRGEHLTLLGGLRGAEKPRRCAPLPASKLRPVEPSSSMAPRSIRLHAASMSLPNGAASRWSSSPMQSGRT
jgi:hypothetical protein